MTSEHLATVRDEYLEDVAGFGEIRIRPVDPSGDVDVIHGWVTEDRARFWGMAGHSRDQVLEIYGYLDSLTTHHAYLVHRDGRPVALLQTYQPSADPVGECYDVQPGDFGIHLLLGPAAEAERGFTATLTTAFLTFLFADPGHRRLVSEPDTRNAKAIARLVHEGFVPGPEIDLPDKRAQLLFLDRGTFDLRSAPGVRRE